MERDAPITIVSGRQRGRDHEDLLDDACRGMWAVAALWDHKGQRLGRRRGPWIEHERARQDRGYGRWCASRRPLRRQ